MPELVVGPIGSTAPVPTGSATLASGDIDGSFPRFFVGADTYVVALVNVGGVWQFGIYKFCNPGWALCGAVLASYNAGDLVAAVNKEGGVGNFIAWLKSVVNTALRALFGGAAQPTAPVGLQTDQQAMVQIANKMAMWQIGGTPPQVQ